MEKKTKKEGVPFSAQKRSEHQWASSQDLLHSVVQQSTPDPQTGLEIKDKPKQSGISDQLLREDFEQKHSQLFWGLPSLHSESIVATLLVPTVGYSLEPHLVLFNGICKGTSVPVQDGEVPPVLQSHPLPLTFVQPQPFPQIEPQSEVLPPTCVHPQVHMKSLLPHVPLLSSSCGNTLHRPENRAFPDILNGNQHLQCPVLQNHPENVWGLVPECQQYEEAFAFPAPNIPLVRQSPQSYVSVPGPCHFHLHSELQEILEPQGPSNLILPWCFQSYSSPGVLTVTDPQFKQTGTSPHNCKCVYSQPSVHWGPSYSDLRIREPSHTESFCERVSIRPQLRKDVARNLGHILGKCPFKNPQVISECYVLNSLNAALETKKNWVCHPRTALENKPLSISRKNLDQNQTKSILRLHMSRKFWQIISGRIPIKVCCSWLADDNTVLPSGNAHTNTDNRASLPFGRVSCYTAMPEIPLLDHKTQQMLEVHLIRFRVNQKWGLPLKVLESIKFYMLREAKTWPLPQFDYPSSPNPISRMNWKTGFPQSPRQSSKSFQGDRVEKRNSVPIMDSLLPAASHVDKEGEGPLRPSHSDTGHEVTEHVQINDGDRQTSLPHVSSSIDKMSQNHTVPENRHAQEQLMKQDVTEPESKTELVHSNNAEIAQDKLILEDPEHLLTPNMSWKIDKAHEAGVLQSESDPTRKLENSEMTNTSSTLLGTKCDPPRTSTLEDSTIDNFKKEVLKELKFKLDNEFQNQAKGYASNTSFTSGSFTCDFLPSSSNSVSSEDFSLSQELHVYLEGKGIHMEPRQNPGVFKHVLKDFKPAERRVSLPGCKRKSGRNEISDLELQIFKAINKSQPGKKGKSDRRPSPPESYFRKIRQAFQWFNFGRENTGRRSPEKDRALFMSCGPPEAHELMAALGKILEEKLLCGRKAEFLEWSQKEKDLQAQPKPIKRQSSNPGTAYTQ